MQKQPLDLTAIRTRLADRQGQTFWRSLEELADTEEFRTYIEREFPKGAGEWRDPAGRRTFLKLMGASLALAGLTACTDPQWALKQPQEKIVPYVRQPEDVIPGRPLYFATSMPAARGYGVGLLAESHEGRPTKLEGNPGHPASLGSSDIFIQASILTMYDPDRSTSVRNANQAATWADFTAAFLPALEAQRAKQGAGLRVLTGTITSPTQLALLARVQGALPQAKFYTYDPITYDHIYEGAQLAFGEYVDTVYSFGRSKVVVALDSDFMSDPATGVRYSRDTANTRRVREERKEMSRIYVAEPAQTVTGINADHRLPVKATAIESLTRALAVKLGVAGVTPGAALTPEQEKWVDVASKDLLANQGASIVLAGPSQPGVVHAIIHAINQALGNVGQTLAYIAPVGPVARPQMAGLSELAAELDSGAVEVLLMVDVNPVYNAPSDLRFAERVAKAGLSVHHGLYADETAQVSGWHINATHFLETWSDLRAFDGTVSIVQPLIAPLYGGKSFTELLLLLVGQPGITPAQALTDYWLGQGLAPTQAGFARAWRTVLYSGLVPNTIAPTKQVALKTDALGTAPAAAVDGLELLIRPDPTIGDGFYANNGWLQECPKPLTKITWENTVQVGLRTAEKLGITSGDVVTVTAPAGTITGPVWIVPGQAEDTVLVHLGYGRTAAGRVGNNIGFNAYQLRSTTALWQGGGVQVAKVGSNAKIASSQMHFLMEKREEDLVRFGTLEQFQADSEFIHGKPHPKYQLFPLYEYKSLSWGMSIDLNVCTGCNACMIACQAENNISVVGKEEVWRGREMHWIRLDQYNVGTPDNPQVYQQPVPCMQCEQAPCELVCPVAATVHDSEGLNNMVYNRCVGTKYCSNNCPYKVRRFNYLLYVDDKTPTLKMQRNPDVTVRSRGVMEKCTYCTQRINEVRIEARRDGNRPIEDGEIQTACQQACPTQAIVFGNINDPNAEVTKLKQEPLKYTTLDLLNVRPRTSYLAKLHNYHPELAPASEGKTE